MFVRTESLRSYVRLYPVNSAFLLICIVMFLIMTLSGGTTDSETLVKFGAFISPFPDSEWRQHAVDLWGGSLDYMRFISAIFIHIGFSHLLFNGFSLFVFAPELERLFGHVRYAIFFLVTGIAGNLASHLDAASRPFQGFTLSAGASGAIFGIFGAYLALVVLRRAFIDKGTYTTIVTLVVMGAIYSFLVPNVSWQGHLGGFLAGFVWMTVLLQMKRPRRS
jgi:rhomboid protease GluP